MRLTGELRVTTTGKTQVPGRPASGEVVFSNLTDKSILLPAGTGVLPAGRPDLRFTTIADLSLPAGKDATARVRVVAARPGLAGNLPSNSLDAIDGPLGLRATVAQPDRLTGGTEIERGAVAQADHATALRLLTEEILTRAASEIEDALEDGEVLAPASLRVVHTPQSTFDREVGATANSVHLDLTLELTALVYRTENLQAAAGLALADKLPTASVAVPGSLAWTLRGRIPGVPKCCCCTPISRSTRRSPPPPFADLCAGCSRPRQSPVSPRCPGSPSRRRSKRPLPGGPSSLGLRFA